MDANWKAVLGFLGIIVLLTGGSVIAGKYVFTPWEAILGEAQTLGESSGGNAPRCHEQEYKKIRLAFNSFDLAAGLTKSDFDAIPLCNTYYFASLWMCVGALFILTKPRKNKKE